jgi:hypothetical protein
LLVKAKLPVETTQRGVFWPVDSELVIGFKPFDENE